MELLLVIVGLVAAVAAEFEEIGNEPITVNYHENYGIAEAARIKALESAPYFNGTRIAGGARSRLGQFPFMGGLVISVPQGTSVCGSALISNNRAVTAAHCWTDGRTQARRFTVVLGSITLFRGGTRINTNNVVVHPNWNPRRITNDIAVIRIRPVTFNANIRAAGLATGSNTFAGSTATAIGFGLRGDNANIANNQPLSHVSVPVITNDVCRRTFGGIQPSNICTNSANGRSPCPGDSGGPLVVGNDVIGIVSFGAAAGCTRGFPAAFTRITSFATWIRAQ